MIEYLPEERRATLVPNLEDSKKYRVMVNGVLCEKDRLLVHGDRVLVGLYHYFIYVDPLINMDEMFEYEDAMKEANKDAMGMLGEQEDFTKKMMVMEERLKHEQEIREIELQQQQSKLEKERQEQLAELKAAQE